MKKYDTPEIDIIKIGLPDVITASLGTETPIKGEEGIWDI